MQSLSVLMYVNMGFWHLSQESFPLFLYYTEGRMVFNLSTHTRACEYSSHVQQTKGQFIYYKDTEKAKHVGLLLALPFLKGE